MAGGAGAGADGGAGGCGGGDGRGPSGGSSSSGGRSLQGECPSVSEAVSRGCARRGAGRPSEEGAVPGWRGGRAVARPPQEAPDRRRGRDSRLSGGEATTASADWRVPVRSEGRAWRCAAVPGAGERGVALGAGRAARQTPGSRLGAPRGGTRRSLDAGKPLPDSGACLPGCGAATAPGWT